MTIRHGARLPLAFIVAGEEVLFAAIGDAVEPHQREQLNAYGLAPGRPLRVLQQHPMTVIQSDEVELALEHAISRHVWVTRPATGS